MKNLLDVVSKPISKKELYHKFLTSDPYYEQHRLVSFLPASFNGVIVHVRFFGEFNFFPVRISEIEFKSSC